MKKKLSPIQVIVIGLVLYFLSRFGIGGVFFELGGAVIFIFGIFDLIKKSKKSK